MAQGITALKALTGMQSCSTVMRTCSTVMP